MFDPDPSILDDRKDETPIPIIVVERLPDIQDSEFLSLRRYRTCLVQFTLLHDDNLTVRRFKRTNEEDVCIRNDHPSYRVCKCEWARILRERELKMSEDVHLSGPLQNLSHEDFQRLFNMDIVERQAHREEIEQALMGMLKYLFCEDKTPVGELRRMAHTGTPAEREEAYRILSERIHINETAKNMLSVWIHKDKTIQYDIIEDAKDEEKKRLREHDKKYKPKPVEQPKKEAKPSKTAQDKMRATMKFLAPAELKAKGKEQELEDWIDKEIIKAKTGTVKTQPVSKDDKMRANIRSMMPAEMEGKSEEEIEAWIDDFIRKKKT